MVAMAQQWTFAMPSSQGTLTLLMLGAMTIMTVHPPSMETILMGGLLMNSSRTRRVLAQCELIKQPLLLPPSRHVQFGEQLTSKR
jgi:hypothetical protein